MKDVMNELIELQTRITYQEDTIQQLNDVITRQDAAILQLQQQMRILAKRVEEVSFIQEGGESIPDERPPHY
jgi:SlyX protein